MRRHSRVIGTTLAVLLGSTSLAMASARVVLIGIDIKPGSFLNSINPATGGATPVAILGDVDFDVSAIDPETLTLGTGGVKTVGKKDRQLCSIEDVSGPLGVPDGLDDLVCHFVTASITYESGDTEATISGNLFDGTPFEGSDSVNIVP